MKPNTALPTDTDTRPLRAPARSKTRMAGKVTLWVLMSIVLLVTGIVVGVYSVWWQRDALRAAVTAVNRQPGMHLEVGDARLIFPLRVKVRDMSLVQNGDTMICLEAADADVRVRPLLDGRVDVSEALLSRAMYRMGSRDSATCIVLRAERIDAAPLSVSLSDTMRIRLERGALSGGLVDMYINPVNTAAPKPPSKPSPLLIEVGHLALSDFAYCMNMLPAIDTLQTVISRGLISDVRIDIAGQTVDVGDFGGSGLDVAYIAPDQATVERIAALPAKVDTVSAPSTPWTVKVDGIHFDKSKVLYTIHGLRPQPGLDFGYIEVDSMNLDITDFYNRASEVRVPLCISGRERSGITLHADGTLAIDSAALRLQHFDLKTSGGTSMNFDAMLGTGTEPDVSVNIDPSDLAVSDLARMFPDFDAYLRPLRAGTRIALAAKITGSMNAPDIGHLSLHIPGALRLDGGGSLHNVLTPKRMTGSIDLVGKLGDIDPWLRLVMGPDAGVRIPPMDVKAGIDFGNGAYSGYVQAVTATGELALDGSFNGRGNVYDIQLDAHRFPIEAFMPSLGISDVTVGINAKGRGLDIMSSQTSADIDLDLAEITYNGDRLTDIGGTLHIADGQAVLSIDSHNPTADFTIEGSGNIQGNRYNWIAAIDGRRIDLMSLKASDTPATVSINADISANFDAANPLLMDASVDLRDFVYAHEAGKMTVDRVRARLAASDTTVNLNVSNRDLFALVSAPTGLREVLAHSDSLMTTLVAQFKRRRINIPEVQRALPRFELDVQAGDNNMLTQVLADSHMGFDNMRLRAYNDTVMALDGDVLGFFTGDTRLDSVGLEIHQHGDHLHYGAKIRNLPGTLDAWAAVDLTGYFRPGRLGINVNQRNIKGQTGFLVGGEVELNADSTATLHITPLNPTIGYQQWTANEGNFIRYYYATKHIDADLHMRSATSSLALYSEHAHEHDNAMHGADEDLVVKVSDIRLQDWIALNPFAPPVKGNISADLRINRLNNALNGEGQLSLAGLTYGREKVGDIRADFDLVTQRSGLLRTNVDLWINGSKTMTLSGALNDSTRTSPFNMDLTMIHFPLSTCNAFLPGVAKLSGTLNGRMDVSGDSDHPQLDGNLQFDQAAIKVNMLGTTFAISDTPIPINNSIVRLNNFSISGCNENPLTVNGTVDVRDMSRTAMDLTMKARNMQIVKSTRAVKGADVYGKAFVNIDAKARGDMSILKTSGSLSVLAPSNFTYIMPDAVNTIQNQSVEDMVHFVNFNDSAAMARADSVAPSKGTALFADFALNINNGTTIGVDLSADGKNRLQLNTQGTLSFSMNPMNSGRMVGRLNILDGYIRYTPPLMSEKKFTFDEESYVAFTGDMLNPRLNIKGVDRLRANVTQEGQNSRLINFDVSLDVTGTLDRMDVAFDLATDDDLTVANELASMSAEQRANEAMNLLLYNTYTGPGTKANAALNANPLYSFLSSQLNSWASKAIKGIDLSFGIDSYDRTTRSGTSQTTRYSYNISKSLFDERFRIAVGGNYSTDADADENLSRNIISDISIEYYLNNAHTTYVRIFRHTGYESILEGEITQTGVGFVYRRKIRRLSDMFRFGRRKGKNGADKDIKGDADAADDTANITSDTDAVKDANSSSEDAPVDTDTQKPSAATAETKNPIPTVDNVPHQK